MPRTLLAALTVSLVVGLGAAGCSSCKRGDDKPPVENKPPDHLAPMEAVEGKEKAFGLPLPRLSKVEARFEKSVHVLSMLTAEELVNFVSVRVKDGKITPGTSSTLLYNVTPVGDPEKRLSLDIHAFRGGDGTMHSQMVVRDTTPPPLEPGLTDEQRWNKAGLTPGGQIADPKHLQ
ncbi:MAG: hypothetical protein JWP87_5973 [Labilithrix sp.]|nr:hypothetical protein [Labilithrix sp.]